MDPRIQALVESWRYQAANVYDGTYQVPEWPPQECGVWGAVYSDKLQVLQGVVDVSQRDREDLLFRELLEIIS